MQYVYSPLQHARAPAEPMSAHRGSQKTHIPPPAQSWLRLPLPPSLNSACPLLTVICCCPGHVLPHSHLNFLAWIYSASLSCKEVRKVATQATHHTSLSTNVATCHLTLVHFPTCHLPLSWALYSVFSLGEDITICQPLVFGLLLPGRAVAHTVPLAWIALSSTFTTGYPSLFSIC